jgi:hypothetical protein
VERDPAAHADADVGFGASALETGAAVETIESGYLLAVNDELGAMGYLLELDAAGAVQWQARYDPMEVADMVVRDDGGIVLHNGLGTLVDLDGSGNVTKTRAWSLGRGLTRAADGTLYLAGLSRPDGKQHAAVGRLDGALEVPGCDAWGEESTDAETGSLEARDEPVTTIDPVGEWATGTLTATSGTPTEAYLECI